MKTKITVLVAILFASLTQAQLTITDGTSFSTRDEMFLANELFQSGEPYAEDLGYNLDDLDPMVLNQPDSLAYTTGIENYEYSRYLLNTVNGRSGIGLHMMWSPIISAQAAMQPSSFDGQFTGGTPNGFKEDDMLMMMIGKFGQNANFIPFEHPFPIYAAFESGDNTLPQNVTADFTHNFGSTHWNRSLMDKTLNLGAMAQTMWKQYYWAQDMLSTFHDGNEDEVVPDGTNSPDFPNSPELDPNNNIFYGGDNTDGFIGQVLTAEAINMTKFTITNLAYDGTSLGGLNPATYNPANGIKYFPTKIAVTETNVATGLPPKLNTLTVTDPTSQLFDQISFLLATSSFRNMMNPNDNSNTAHLAYHEVFDGSPFPASMSETGTPGPFDLVSGAGKVTLMNIMAMHFKSSMGTFVNTATLNSSGQPVMGTEISAENAGYIIVALAKVAKEYAGTPLANIATNGLTAQANFILNHFKDTTNGGYYNSVDVNNGGSSDAKTISATGSIIRGLYAAYVATNDTNFLNEANAGYQYMIQTFYSPSSHAFLTEAGNPQATYTPWNLSVFSGAMREAKLVGNQNDSPAIYTRVFKNVYNQMLITEAEATGETGNDSDGDGIPYIVGNNRPFVFVAEATLDNIITLSISNSDLEKMDINIYPNPVKDILNVDLTMENNSKIKVSISDLSGRTILQKTENVKSGRQNINLNLTNLNRGIYLININVGQDKSLSRKLIVE